MAAGSFAPSLSLSDHSSAAGYSTAGGVTDGAFNVSFGTGAAGTAPRAGFASYLPIIAIAGGAYLLFRHKLKL